MIRIGEKILNGNGKEIPKAVETRVLERTLEFLSTAEREGYGMKGNGRLATGAPVRTTASSIASELGLSRADVEAVLEAHFKRVREGNRVFYSL